MTKSNSKKFASGVAGLLTAVCLACPALAATLPVTQLANPVPGTTNVAASGTVTAKITGNTENFNQSTGKAIVDFSSFNVGSHTGAPETVNFNNNSSTAVMTTLARIHDTSASKIYGTINDAHGVLILANGNGIYFKSGSHVNVGGLIATTSAITNADFLNDNRYHFTPGTNPSATIINDGTITTKLTTAQGGGLVAFLAPTVKNNGTIDAKAGQVILAGGDTATFVDLYGDGLINLATNGKVESLLIENGGKINANGGNVRLTAGTAKTVVDSLINMDGVIQADSVHGVGGKVTLQADSVEMNGGEIYADGGKIGITGFEGTKWHTDGVLLDHTKIYAGDGDITIFGKGYGTPTTPSYGNNHGVHIRNGSKIVATDSGKISITGIGGNGDGWVGERRTSADNNYGVFIEGRDTKVTAEAGDIVITGFGGGQNAKHGSGEDYGVLISGGAEVSTKLGDSHEHDYFLKGGEGESRKSGDIIITGFGGGCSEWCGNNIGVYITDGITDGREERSFVGGGDSGHHTLVSSDTGNINIFGKGGGNLNSNKNYGVFVTNNAGVESRTGDIKITGIGGANDYYATRNNYGIVITDGGWVGGKKFAGEKKHDDDYKLMSFDGGHDDFGGYDSGDITFVTDTIYFDNTARVRTSGDVFFEPFSPWTTIGIAGAPGTLQLTETLLNDVFAGTVTIGNTFPDWGKITANEYDWRMPVSILNGWGDIEIDGIQTINGNDTFWGKKDNTFRAVTAWGDIIIGEEGGVISGEYVPEGSASLMEARTLIVKQPETLITLAASFGKFLNYSGLGADTLQPGNGRWLVYSFSPVDDVFGGLSSGNTAIWGTVYNEHHKIKPSGDRYVFTVCPTLTVTFDDLHKFFGADGTAMVAGDAYTLDYTVRGLDHLEHDLLAYVGDAFIVDPSAVVIGDRTSAGSPATAPVGAYDDILGLVTSGADGFHVKYVPGTLTVSALNLNNVLDRSHAPGRRGPNGTLLSIVNNPLANLAPAAGGGTGNLSDLSPKAGGDLSNLAPQAGGNASITPLIQCNEVTPCDINQ